jgi:hypothetical protein
LLPAAVVIAFGVYLAYSDLTKNGGFWIPLVVCSFGFLLPFIIGGIRSMSKKSQAKQQETQAAAQDYKDGFISFMKKFYNVDENSLENTPDVTYVHNIRTVHSEGTTYTPQPNVLFAGRFRIDGTVREAKFERLVNDIVLMHNGTEIQPVLA